MRHFVAAITTCQRDRIDLHILCMQADLGRVLSHGDRDGGMPRVVGLRWIKLQCQLLRYRRDVSG